MCTSAADDGLAASPPPAANSTSATVSVPLAEARTRIFGALQGQEVPLQVLHHPKIGHQFQDFVLYTNEQQGIDNRFRPSDDQGNSDGVGPLKVTHLPPGTVEAALVAYVALPEAARTNDLLLSHGRMGYHDYWRAPEYQRAGEGLPYRADYIVHFAPVNSTTTRLEVIAFGAWVLDGKEWRVLAGQDGLGLPWPRKVDKMRDVLPSRVDKEVVLAHLLKLAE